MSIVHLHEIGMLVHDFPDVAVLLLIVHKEVFDGDFRKAKQLDKLILFRLEILFQVKVEQSVIFAGILFLYFSAPIGLTVPGCLVASRALAGQHLFLAVV